ncbi:hypothetical protein BDP55DRAFT_311684 [Colletotrichum godetiae]|uniref:Uncharacterized protein n=1 Tax=Colletotrichum godetiae TaxID=1209918 RepID=A0AAJ0AXW3_9PEZI|nr:uncharacterized protein BDP55DRAFT_311684 [Colletotrichum godetiae]KAK1690875.1 hypothetical protein BDP55DRAFT_311684 [Colletotrichum godetiae]
MGGGIAKDRHWGLLFFSGASLVRSFIFFLSFFGSRCTKHCDDNIYELLLFDFFLLPWSVSFTHRRGLPLVWNLTATGAYRAKLSLLCNPVAGFRPCELAPFKRRLSTR